MGSPLPRCCCNCGDPVTMSHLGAAAAESGEQPPSWVPHLVASDFSKPCSRDRVCNTCGGAAFCGHCCIEFSSELCAHHGVGHEIIPVVEHDGWHVLRAMHWLGVVDPPLRGRPDFPGQGGQSAGAPAEEASGGPGAWREGGEGRRGRPVPVVDGSTGDRVCNTCGGASYCQHCCSEHHRGHDTVAAIAEEKDGSEATVVHRRDSFCTGCRVAFCSDLCAHHTGSGGGHEVIPVDLFIDWHCARCTGWEWWFPALHYLLMLVVFRDEHGNLFVPLQWKREMAGQMDGAKVEDGEKCPWWMAPLVNADFSKMCTRDRVCNTCGGAGFCEHCCREQHGGHDTCAAARNGMEGCGGYRRDSFCTSCGVAFCSELCGHHAGGEGHEVRPVDVYGDRHFMRCTGSERWFASACGDIETYEDRDGNLMVPLERKRSMFPEPGLKYATRHCAATSEVNPFCCL